MPGTRRYPPEIRERPVRLVFDHEHEYPSQWKAIRSIAEKSDLNRETPERMGPRARSRSRSSPRRRRSEAGPTSGRSLAPSGAERDPDRVCELVHAALHSAPRIFVVGKDLAHGNLLAGRLQLEPVVERLGASFEGEDRPCRHRRPSGCEETRPAHHRYRDRAQGTGAPEDRRRAGPSSDAMLRTNVAGLRAETRHPVSRPRTVLDELGLLLIVRAKLHKARQRLDVNRLQPEVEVAWPE